MATKRTNLQERYELREVLGRGGMGVVYKAWDTLMGREVALKTILVDNPETIALFYKEWSLLSTMVHPNIVGIYDIGEFVQEGAKKPFFVMPLLPGVSLDRLIKEASPRLTVQGVIEIIDQAARGLYAAHEQGLVHRDVKPSNIFVMDDNSVKIIDFGIARAVSTESRTSLKGTLYYLAPEQLELKQPTPLSDLFALGVVTYEALTRRRPFQGASDTSVIEAIQRHSPPPASEINQNVSYAISQVVHKAIAKQPWHRFFNTREFGDALQKAFRNEPLAYFDSAKIKPRLERAAKSFEQGDYAFASEMLSELEAEGHLDQEIALLRGQLDQAMQQIRIQQLLESARRFFEATEYPLALRKIQEALELDPNDALALSLKAQVEKDRREKKIEEWIALAQQHLDNQAFRQARDALDNVIRLKPNETEALKLLAEVGRREQEVAHAREEKSRLYQAAMQCWEKGDVTSALSKIEAVIAMDRDLPESDSGRASSYQSFYNQVHSEHNAIKSGYEEARRNLSAKNFDAALVTCRQYLSKYPNHALFQALKFDVEERRRHNLSAVIAETDRRVEQEQDLDKRIGILEEALRLYPGENHFEFAMQLVRDKRDLVNSIVGKAHFFEERGQYNEALDQWQILRSIHENQPGLAFEIQRLMKRRDQQARENAKSRWVEQADKYLEAGDYDRAMKTVQNALAEFPGETELLELDKLVRKNQERGSQALELLSRARELGEKGGLEQSLELLREAFQLDPRNMVIRTVLVNSLLTHARRLADSEWESAEATLEELLRIEPQNAPARSLASQITDRKHEEFVAWCLSQARRMQTDGDLGGALAVVVQGLESYPNEQRLQQLQGTLQRAQTEAKRQTPPAPAPVVPRELSKPRIPAEPSEPVTVPPPPPEAPAPVVAESSGFATNPLLTPPPPTPAPAPPTPPVLTDRPEPPAGDVVSPHRNKLVYSAIGIAAAIALAVGVVKTKRPPAPSTPEQPAGASFKVSLRSSPPGALITVSGQPCGTSNCELQLAPGSYQAEARLAGYQPATLPFQVETGKGAPEINLALSPLPPGITVSTDLKEGTVSLDDVTNRQIQPGEIELANVTPGKHTLSVRSGASRASIPLEINPGSIPQLTGPMQTFRLKGFVVAHFGGQARLYSSVEGVQVTVDGKPAGAVGKDGLELKDLSPGPHAVTLGSSGQQQKVAFDSGPAVGVFASLVTDENLGVLRVLAGSDDVTVYVNGEKQRRTTQNGRLLLYLVPRQYKIRVEKPGFASPPEQVVELKRGEEATLEFKMLLQRATLAIRNSAPGTEVWVDGFRIGTVRNDNTFSGDIEPGKRTVLLKHEHYKSTQADYLFVSGKTIELEGKMEALLGSLKIEVNPPGINPRLRIRRQGDTQDREITETALSLPEGSYTVSASAARYQDGSATVRVTANRPAVASLVLKLREIKQSPKQASQEKQPSFVLDDWMKSGWVRSGSTLIRKGGEFVFPTVQFPAGTFQFTAILNRGKRIEWVLDYRDQKNYCLFQVDDKNFVRIEVVNGKRTETAKVAHGMNRKEPIGIGITVKASSITHRILRSEQGQVIDVWQRPVPQQQIFGFHIPGRDEIGLVDFRFVPD